jgi:Flp pilus assembly protein TadD
VAELIKEFPKSADVQSLQGSIELGRRKYDAARAAFVRAQQLDPRSFAAFNGLVSVEMLSGKVPSARALVESRLKTAPDDVDTLLVAARVYFNGNDGAAAERTLRRVIELAPREDSAYTLLAQLYLAQGRVDAAQAEFQKIAERDPKDVGARTIVAMILHSRGDTAAARKLYEEILAVDGNALIPANNLAWILAEENGDLDRALTLAQRVVQQRPDSPDFNATVGRVYLQKQLPMLAIDPLERAVKLSPDNADFQFHLGTAYANAGNASKAKAALTKALAMDPTSPRAQQARELLASLPRS